MSAHTKKVGSLGRYGPRIGRKLRDEMKQIEDHAKKNRCPGCNGRVKRKAAGIYRCRSCGKTFTGGAYWTFEEAQIRVKSESASKPTIPDEPSVVDEEKIEVDEPSVVDEEKIEVDEPSVVDESSVVDVEKIGGDEK